MISEADAMKGTNATADAETPHTGTQGIAQTVITDQTTVVPPGTHEVDALTLTDEIHAQAVLMIGDAIGVIVIDVIVIGDEIVIVDAGTTGIHHDQIEMTVSVTGRTVDQSASDVAERDTQRPSVMMAHFMIQDSVHLVTCPIDDQVVLSVSDVANEVILKRIAMRA